MLSRITALVQYELTGLHISSIENHWLTGFQHPVKDFDFSPTTDLYKYLGHSDWTNWLDWAYLRYDADSWFATVGKDMIYLGGFEADEYDYDVHPVFMSSLWNNMASYQWQVADGHQPAGQYFSLRRTSVLQRTFQFRSEMGRRIW